MNRTVPSRRTLTLVPPLPPSVPPYEPPVCPPWCCRTDHEIDCDEDDGVRFADHRSDPVKIVCADKPYLDNNRTIRVELELYEHPDYVPEPTILVVSTVLTPPMVAIASMGLDEADQLVRNLQATIAMGRATATTASAHIKDCVDCGHEFELHYSPDLDRCWECAERVDAEAVAR